MKNLIIIALMVSPSFCLAGPDCSRMDFTKVMSKEQKQVDELLGNGGWKKDVYVCDLGNYKIIVPASENKREEVFLFDSDGPILLVEEGIGVNLYDKSGKVVYNKYLKEQDALKRAP